MSFGIAICLRPWIPPRVHHQRHQMMKMTMSLVSLTRSMQHLTPCLKNWGCRQMTTKTQPEVDVDVMVESILMHAYDPAKAHEYYVRNRKLKGRRSGAQKPSGGGRSGGASRGGGSRGTGSRGGWNRPSRRQHLEAEKDHLEARLDRLRDILQSKVDAAKRRSGVKVEKKTDKKDTDTADKAKSKDKGKSKDKSTPAEKKEKAKKAREEYAKEHMSLSTEVRQLHEQIRDIQKQIREAVARAQQANQKTAAKGR